MSNGIVYLVGGGPGDPELLTIKGLNCLKKCDVVIYDALINPVLLENCPESAEKIFVGKRRHRHTFEQNEINALMLKHARAGKIVCRLKGGDPFLFGRGGEEAEFLFQHGIPFEIISGVSSIIAVPAAGGIPLTHRNYSSYVAIATGHENENLDDNQEFKNSSGSEWVRYVPKKTLVVLMGFHRLKPIADKLMDSGWPKDTPIALICSGTLPNQLTVAGTLSNIAKKVEKLRRILSAPGMIIVGEVVSMREKISPSALEIDLLPIDKLKAHEETIPERVKKIRQEIVQSGQLETPLWVEKEKHIVLNGHHRLRALKDLDCDIIPCLLFDYSSLYIDVQICPGAVIKSIDKKSVIDAALTGNLFPPRSSLHILKFNPPNFTTELSLLGTFSRRALSVRRPHLTRSQSV